MRFAKFVEEYIPSVRDFQNVGRAAFIEYIIFKFCGLLHSFNTWS